MKLENCLRYVNLNTTITVITLYNKCLTVLYSGSRKLLPSWYDDKRIVEISCDIDGQLQFILNCRPIVVNPNSCDKMNCFASCSFYDCPSHICNQIDPDGSLNQADDYEELPFTP